MNVIILCNIKTIKRLPKLKISHHCQIQRGKKKKLYQIVRIRVQTFATVNKQEEQ